MDNTKQTVLEEEFNLPPLDGMFDDDQEIEEESDYGIIENSIEDQDEDSAKKNINSVKADRTLTEIRGLDEHDQEMDDIAKKAMKSYDELMSLGMNVPDMHAGRIFEVAANMLGTALNAKNSKIDRKLRQLALQLKKVKIDSEINPEENSGTGMDRNAIIAMFKSRAISTEAKEVVIEPEEVSDNEPPENAK